MDSHRPSFSVSKPPIFIHSFPGAWPSEPTLSEETPVECPAPEDAVPPLHLAETTNTEGFMRRVVVNPAGRRSTRVSVATYDDNESVLSDDFYSFISQYDEDVDATILPEQSDMKVDSFDETKDAFISVFQPANLDVLCGHNEGPDQNATEDTTSSSSEEALSLLDLSTCIGGSDTSPSSEQCKISPDSNHFSCSPQIFLKLSNEHNGRTPRTTIASSSPRQSILSESLSSSGSAHYGDEESNHNLDQSEDESAVSYSRVCNLIEQLDYTNNSEESISLHMPSTPPHRARQSLQGHRPMERQESDLDITHLSQPDGDNPWTLALEPAFINLSEFASASRTSVSVESSSVAHDEEPVAPTPRVQSPNTTLPRPSFATARNEVGSRIGLGRPSVDLPPPAHSGSVAATAQSSVQKKAVMQKTKSLYQKMKRFFTPKSSRQSESRRIPSDMITASSPDINSPLPYSSPYFQESSSQWSLHRRAFQRSAKSSAPSITGSYTPEAPPRSLSCRSGITEESRHTFENPRSPLVDGIRPPSRRARRFSVPTPISFSAPKHVGPPSSAKNASVLTNRSYRKRWSTSLRPGG